MKIVVFLQRQSEEFAERMTTFMTLKVVSSLNIKQAITLLWWLCFLSWIPAGR